MSLLIIIAFLLSPVSLGPGDKAFAAEPSDEIGYSIAAELPENQIDKTQTYFDLRMEPSLEQDLRVVVSNNTNEPITINVSAISASTNRNGIKDYRTPNIKDETLKIPFSEIARVKEPVFTVAANSSYPAVVTVKMPASSFDGVILGGINVTRDTGNAPAVEPTGEANISIENVYSYVVGVILSETDVVVKPDFEYVDVVPTLVNSHPTIEHSIRNKNAAIANSIELEANVYKVGSSSPIKTFSKNVDMAPNSTMPLSMLLDSELEPGDYHATIDLSMDGETWFLERDFSISAEEAIELNNNSVFAALGLPNWATMLIALGAAIIICGLVLLILLLKRRRRKDDEY